MAVNPEKPPLVEDHVALGARSGATGTRAGVAVHPSGTQSASEHDAVGSNAPDVRRPSYRLQVSDSDEGS
jgi:hypothetical protein